MPLMTLKSLFEKVLGVKFIIILALGWRLFLGRGVGCGYKFRNAIS
jgi:hypothetical protein